MSSIPQTYSFSCGGWLKIYMFGVARALQEHHVIQDSKLIGCSAGALVATALALDVNTRTIANYVIQEIIPLVQKKASALFQVREFLQQTFQAKGELYRYEELNTRLQPLVIVYTSLSALTSRRITKFQSKEHLEQCLLASCCAPVITGLPFKIGQEWVVDGMFLDFQPLFPSEKNVTISPFYCVNADIKPSKYVPLWWSMCPPGVEDMEWLFELGYQDGLNWLSNSGLLSYSITTKGIGQSPSSTFASENAWTTSVGRVLGYRRMESRILDALFIGLVVCLWKPLTFALLYLELYVQAFLFGSKAAIWWAAVQLRMSRLLILSSMLLLAVYGYTETLWFIRGVLGMIVLFRIIVELYGGLHEASAAASREWNHCISCIRTISSLSLLLRGIPVIGKSFRVKRHEVLSQYSLVYRLTQHFV